MKPASRFRGLIFLGSLSFLALLAFSGCQTDTHWRAGEHPRYAQLTSAANNGDAKAQNELGLIFLHSHPRDNETAMKWFMRAADQGYAPAQFNIGQMYWHGHPNHYWYGDDRYNWKGQERYYWWYGQTRCYWHGDKNCSCQNYSVALKWFEKAAEQNYSPAFTAIGFAYKNGRAVPQSYKEAMNWFRQAAAYNEAEAEYQLGILYDNGFEFQANRPEAYKWFLLSASQGHAPAIKARDNSATKLTREQLDEAQQRALAFTPKPQSPAWQ